MSYIGNTPGVSSQRVVLEEVITGSPKSAFVPISGYIKGYVDVLINGVEIDTADFTAADGVTVTLGTAAAVGDTVKIKTWLPRGLSDGYLKSEADARFLNLAGGTLTGALLVQGSTGTVSLNAAGDQLLFNYNGYNYVTANGAAATLQLQATGANGVVTISTAGVTRATFNASGLTAAGNLLMTANDGNARVVGVSNGTNTTLVLQGGGNGAGALGGNIELGRDGNNMYDAGVSRFRSLDGSTIYGQFDANGLNLPTGGIKFPAAQVASSDANTLDDYEEGTWTPTLGGTATYINRSGRYTKIGNKVFIEAILEVSTIGTGNQTDISGLPFTTNSTPPLGTVSVGYFASAALSVSFLSATIGQNGTAINLRHVGAGGSTGMGAPVFFQNNTAIFLTAQYSI